MLFVKVTNVTSTERNVCVLNIYFKLQILVLEYMLQQLWAQIKLEKKLKYVQANMQGKDRIWWSL